MRSQLDHSLLPKLSVFYLLPGCSPVRQGPPSPKSPIIAHCILPSLCNGCRMGFLEADAGVWAARYFSGGLTSVKGSGWKQDRSEVVNSAAVLTEPQKIVGSSGPITGPNGQVFRPLPYWASWGRLFFWPQLGQQSATEANPEGLTAAGCLLKEFPQVGNKSFLSGGHRCYTVVCTRTKT